VDRVRAFLARMDVLPERREANVVLPAAQRAGPVPRRERGRLVEEEELGELAGLHQRLTVPALELEPARDPALRGVAAANAPLVVVQAPAVPVDEPPRRVRDQLAERRDAIL